MCLLAVALNQSEYFPLILAANRDEFHQRPAAALHWWDQPQPILAGRDLSAGGTWLGLNRRGHWGALVNRPLSGQQANADPASFRSRGELIPNWLESDLSPQDFLRQLLAEADAYRPFNLIVGEVGGAAAVLSSPERRTEPLLPGVYAFSNCAPSADWPKVSQLRCDLQAWLRKEPSAEAASSAEADFCQQLIAMMSEDKSPFSDVSQGQLSAARFILSPGYGTRCSTAVVISSPQQQARVWAAEARWDAAGKLLPEGKSDFCYPVSV